MTKWRAQGCRVMRKIHDDKIGWLKVEDGSDGLSQKRTDKENSALFPYPRLMFAREDLDISLSHTIGQRQVTDETNRGTGCHDTPDSWRRTFVVGGAGAVNPRRTTPSPASPAGPRNAE